MKSFLITQSFYMLRIFLAAVCGGLIGYERESHSKMAGIRTHAIVSLTSALMMIISKYGFFDVLAQEGIGLDPSRIAAGVVTAIGFLGASVIFVRKMNISGLTTAAGIWGVVGIGIALGGGMYLVGIASTLMLLLIQFVFHHKFRFVKSSSVDQITLCIDQSNDINEILKNTFSEKEIQIVNLKVSRLPHDKLQFKLYVRFPESYDVSDIMELLRAFPEITSIDI